VSYTWNKEEYTFIADANRYGLISIKMTGKGLKELRTVSLDDFMNEDIRQLHAEEMIYDAENYIDEIEEEEFEKNELKIK